MLCDTCRNYPRHIEEFEGLREISLSLSCPEAARILLSQKEKVHFVTIEKEAAEETYDDFDYFLFTALMDTRDLLIKIIQNRNVPIRKRLWKVLAITHDFQLCLNKNELFKWEEIRKRHEDSGFGKTFCDKVHSRMNTSDTSKDLFKNMWKTIVPEMEVLRPGWKVFHGIIRCSSQDHKSSFILKPVTESCHIQHRGIRSGKGTLFFQGIPFVEPACRNQQPVI